MTFRCNYHAACPVGLTLLRSSTPCFFGPGTDDLVG